MLIKILKQNKPKQTKTGFVLIGEKFQKDTHG